MQLTPSQIETVLHTALSFTGRPYATDFHCVDFVRKVYAVVGIVIPKLTAENPPEELNIKKEDVESPPVGHLMFLKDRDDPRRERAWTHVVIIFPHRTCMHCSLFFGERVILSTLDELFTRYDFAKSKTLPT